MAKRRPRRQVPGTILRDIMLTRTPDELIEDLAVPHKTRAAYWRLMELGPQVEGVVRRGLRHADPIVRGHCCQFLDHYLSESAYPDLLACLDDPDPRVRFWASHALRCERCKAGAFHPPAAEVAAAVAAKAAGPLPMRFGV